MRAPLFYKRRFCNETPVSAARVVGNKLVYLPRDARAAVMSVETIGTRAGEVEGKLDCTRCTFVCLRDIHSPAFLRLEYDCFRAISR